MENSNMTRPTQVTVSTDEYLQWCARAKTGELSIPSVVCTSQPGTYKINLIWPEKTPEIQKDLFGG